MDGQAGLRNGGRQKRIINVKCSVEQNLNMNLAILLEHLNVSALHTIKFQNKLLLASLLRAFSRSVVQISTGNNVVLKKRFGNTVLHCSCVYTV